jgi:flagellar motor switch protein FliN
MKTYIDCWIGAASALFEQALVGAPELAESLPEPLAVGCFGFAATLSGDPEGTFSVLLDGAILKSPLVGEGVDQKAGWGELLREVADAAAGELLAATGQRCRVEKFVEIGCEGEGTRAFLLRSGDRTWTILVRDELIAAQPDAGAVKETVAAPATEGGGGNPAPSAESRGAGTALSPGIELLLDVELEASLRFGCHEMPLGEILDLGPGDVVQLDRHLTDPVDLIVSDKIVARGQVVLVNGNFGLRVTEVAEPKKRLETIRCLF